MTLHTLSPTHFYNAIGAAEPALHVQDGDTVVVHCVDAHGFDHNNLPVAHGPNPMSGPVFIEGAAPGDTLAVRIERIVPSRRFGWSRAHLAPNVVEPDFVRELPWPPEGSSHEGAWDIDMEAGRMTLTGPQTSVGRLVLPLDPMIGCFGVCPAGGEAISTATSAQHGGNMDYRLFRAGVTAYFPVAVPGALFFVGDLHARQGDGEICGTGVEVSGEVEVTLWVQKGRTIGWPRGESDTHIFVVGNARPLDQALQHATTEMVRWLVAEHGFDAKGAQVLMGQVVEYDIANVYDPAYSVACLMAKKWLASRSA
jgi:acetamidase/formamidase